MVMAHGDRRARATCIFIVAFYLTNRSAPREQGETFSTRFAMYSFDRRAGNAGGSGRGLSGATAA